MVRVFLHTLSPEMPRTLTSLDTDILSIPGASVRSVQGSREKGRGLGFRVYAKVPALRLRFGKYGVKDNNFGVEKARPKVKWKREHDGQIRPPVKSVFR